MSSKDVETTENETEILEMKETIESKSHEKASLTDKKNYNE